MPVLGIEADWQMGKGGVQGSTHLPAQPSSPRELWERHPTTAVHTGLGATGGPTTTILFLGTCPGPGFQWHPQTFHCL